MKIACSSTLVICIAYFIYQSQAIICPDDIPHCKTCDAKGCSGCIASYSLFNGSCISCKVSSCK